MNRRRDVPRDEEGYPLGWEEWRRTPEHLASWQSACDLLDSVEFEKTMDRHDCLCGEVLTELRAFRREWKEAMSVLDDDLAALSTGLDTANTGLAGMETEIAALLAAQASGGLTPGQTAQLASLQAKVTAINATIAGTPPFPVVPPAQLSLVSISPLSVPPGTVGVVLSVTGTGFVNGSIVNWDNVNLVTTFVNSGLLTAVVPDANVASPDPSVAITVANPDGSTSAAITFVVGAAGSAAVIAAASAARAVPGAPKGTHGPGTQ